MFQCKSIAFASQGHKDFDHNFIYSKGIRVTGSKTAAEDCKNPNLQSQIGRFGNLQLYFSLSVFFYAQVTTPTLLVILMAISNIKHIFRRIINPFAI